MKATAEHSTHSASRAQRSSDNASPFFSPQKAEKKDAVATAEPFFQPKLKVGAPNDKYEQEADAVADQVVQRMAEEKARPQVQSKVEASPEPTVQRAVATPTLTPLPISRIQRSAEPEAEEQVESEGEEVALQRKPIFDSDGDGDQPVQRKCAACEANEEEGHVHRFPAAAIPGGIQRKCAACEAEEQIQPKAVPALQRSGDGGFTASPDFSSQLASSRGGGSPLPADTRASMESGIGADFSGVRVHTGSEASSLSSQIGAQAFTHGSDVFFNEGNYAPGTEGGDRLLAHELTHTVQQGGSDVSRKPAKTSPPAEAAPVQPTDAIDIKDRFNPSLGWRAYLEHAIPKAKGRRILVPVKIGGEYRGNILVSINSKVPENTPGRYMLFNLKSRQNYLVATGMSFLNPLRPKLEPVILLNQFGSNGEVTGVLTVAADGIAVPGIEGLMNQISKLREEMGFLGLKPLKMPKGSIENVYENGRLVFQVTGLTTTLDGFLDMSGGLGIVGDRLTFDLNTKVDVKGLASGDFTVRLDEKGEFSGKATIESQIGNVHAIVVAEYLAGAVTIEGTGKISSEKFNGQITLLVTDAVRSKQMMHAALGVEVMEDDKKKKKKKTPKAPTSKTKKNQVLAGWGEVEAKVTDWLVGTVKIGVDAEGHVTMVGELAVPDEIELMEQKGKKVTLFELGIKAGYGIPLVGQVFLFADISLFVNAGFGPLVLKGVKLTGTYSTDPAILQAFDITGTLGINAFAILGLTAEAGVGLTLLGHDLKAGISATAAAGIKAYAIATPLFEYRESQAPEGGKVGEARLKGHFEAAAQAFLQLSGSLFYELDSPWWSPAPDGRTDYPLGDLQWPLGETGIGADVDWVVGSPNPPELKFAPVAFDGEQFTNDIFSDPPPKKLGKADQEPKGDWEDKSVKGDKKDPPEVNKDGKGIDQGKKQKENLKNLPDEQKYMRGLDEISKLAKITPKLTASMAETRAKAIQKKYGLGGVKTLIAGDEILVYVKHKKQDNTRKPVKIPVMTVLERTKLLYDAMTDFNATLKGVAGEDGRTSKSEAEAMLKAWLKKYPIIESARVVDGGARWDYFIDTGEKSNTETGKLKSEVAEVSADPAKADGKDGTEKAGTFTDKDKQSEEKDPATPENRTPQQKQADLTRARNKVNDFLGAGIVSQSETSKKLAKLKNEYQLKELSIKKDGKRFKIHGSVNPEYNDYADPVKVVSNDALEVTDKAEIQSFFRAVSLKELENIIRDGLMRPRSKKDGSQRGEFGLTTNKEYTVENIVYSKANKNVNAKMKPATAAKAKYAVVLRINVLSGTKEKLREEYGVGFHSGHPLTKDLPTADEKGSTNIIEMKVETIHMADGDIENVNYMFKSEKPGEIQPGDPLFLLNKSIVSIEIVGGIVPEGMDFLKKAK